MHRATRGLLPIMSALLIAALLLACAVEPSAAGNETKRRDGYIGTTDEGIRMESGQEEDTVIRVRPPEAPDEPEHPMPPVIVEPKVDWPPKKQGGNP